MEQRKILAEKHPGIAVTQSMKIIGEKWRNLTDDEKKPFYSMSEEAHRVHAIAIQ